MLSMATIPQALGTAVQHHQAGRLAEAEAMYRQILNVHPTNADALHLLGVLASQAGHNESAVDLMRRAIQLRPDLAVPHLNLGNSLRALNRIEEAADAYRRAIQLKPDFAEAHNNLGATLKEQGKLDEAIAAYRTAIQCRPGYAEAHNNLGVALWEQHRLDEAVSSYRRALQIQPEFADAHYNLANALRDQMLIEKAIAAYRRAVELSPTYALAWNNLGNLLESMGKIAEAEAAFRQGIALNPNFAALHNNLGNVLKNQGNCDDALPCYRQAMQLDPHSGSLHSNFLAALDCHPKVTPADLLEAHCEFDRRHAAPMRAAWRPHKNTRDPERPLRVGFVSPRFAFHPVGRFLIRPLENLDRGAFHVTCYSDTRTADAMTARIKAAASSWREVAAESDDQLAERIRADEIDVLFDLAGHTVGNRLAVFARKPAPIQITWLDYDGTTGLTAMDYLLADAREIPPGAERWYREKILRMPGDFLCYDPPPDASPVKAPPALALGQVTFGSFNATAKISPLVVRVWSRILHQMPGSRMILKSRGLDASDIAGRFRRLFAEHGIPPDRVELLGWSPYAEALDCYHRVDLALDAFPYNGGLTTCEALWMGVPVVTLPGETFASRHGLTHLTAAGVPETIARDFDHYVEIAVNLASDLSRLAEIRGGLRARVAASPLCDGRRFAGQFAVLLRDAWRRWCRRS